MTLVIYFYLILVLVLDYTFKPTSLTLIQETHALHLISVSNWKYKVTHYWYGYF